MFRRSDEDFARFRVALRNTDQEHVVVGYVEHLSESVLESGSVEETKAAAAVIQPTEDQCQPVVEDQCQPVVEQVAAIKDEVEVEQRGEDISLHQQDQCEFCRQTDVFLILWIFYVSATIRCSRMFSCCPRFSVRPSVHLSVQDIVSQLDLWVLWIHIRIQLDICWNFVDSVWNQIRPDSKLLYPVRVQLDTI